MTHDTTAPTTDISSTAPLLRITAPYKIAEETYLIPNVIPAGPDLVVGMNSMLIRGKEPVIVDTGTPLHSPHWFDMVLSLVDPKDIRWVFLSHDDGDHVGSLRQLMEMAPNATVVANFFMKERMSVEPCAPPLNRMHWLAAGESFDAGDRTLHLVTPAIFDGPTTRGLYDPTTKVMWAVDTFACMKPTEAYELGDIPAPLYDETFLMFNSLISPWHEWLDASKYNAHIDELERLDVEVAASAHGPVLRGEQIHDGYERIRTLAGQPRIPGPGPEVLEQMIAMASVPVQLPG